MCDNLKWSCIHCTYLNYGNAQKCTMCGISKASQIIMETGCAKAHYDIKQLKITNLKDEQSKGDRWSCTSCTYLNYAKTQRCTQCNSLQQNSISEQIGSLTLSEKKPSIKLEQELSGAEKLSPTTDSHTGLVANPQSSFHNFKWRCKECTYENWPRALKCIMCKTNRGIINKFGDSQAASEEISLISQPNKNLHPLRLASKCDNDSDNGLMEDGKCVITTEECETINELNKSFNGSQPLISPSESSNRTSRNTSPTQNASSQTIQSLSLRQNEGAMALNNYETERLLRQFRRRLREADWVWLNACIGVVDGNFETVHAYLTAGGDPMRTLTSQEVKILSRPSAFDEGHTLVHLAIRFGREDLLATILSRIDGSNSGIKRMPSYVAPDLANDIRRHIASSFRQRKGTVACHFVTELTTYCLPADIEDLPTSVQEQLFEEILDKGAQKELEEDAPIINWSLEITDRLGSRLYALWNRTAGDCLLDSLLQATWSVFDNDNVLRRALSESLSDCAHLFYPMWKEYECWQARLLNYYATEGQLLEEWSELVCLASQPRASLEQLHILVLSHIFRRPIIVYGVKNVKSFRGENLGFARFEGVYLPLLWEKSFCWKSPLALGYTRGHFCSLIPMEPESMDNLGAGAILDSNDPQVAFLPLMSHDGKLLPIHFLTQAHIGCEEDIFRTWMEVCVTESGILVAQQSLVKPPLNVAQMTQEWINHYKRMAQMTCAPFSRPISTQGYSSDGDSEGE